MGAPLVLVVDDDPQVLAGLTRIGRDLPLQLVCVDSAEAAWKFLISTRPAGILTDYRLPGSDGVTLLEKATARYPGLRCMLYTGEAVHRTSIPLDFPVVSKPCAPEELRKLLLSLPSPEPES